jgi:hypothetical protein
MRQASGHPRRGMDIHSLAGTIEKKLQNVIQAFPVLLTFKDNKHVLLLNKASATLVHGLSYT